jgi:hypothetical protein
MGLFLLCRPVMIFEGRLESNPERCRSKQARNPFWHSSLFLAYRSSDFIACMKIFRILCVEITRLSEQKSWNISILFAALEKNIFSFIFWILRTLLHLIMLKWPKLEIFVAGSFTQIRPVWVGGIGTTPKIQKVYVWGLLLPFLSRDFCFSDSVQIFLVMSAAA